MSDNSLYDIYTNKCYALAHTMVFYSELMAKAQNNMLENNKFVVNHSNPSSWKYHLNLAGEYHDYDKYLISKLNSDGHPFMRIKIAGDNAPVVVDFTKELMSGKNGDYTLAAEYKYGSDYYNELLNAYPGCESLILGILNPISRDILENATDGDILYCGGYYRKELPFITQTFGFEKREDIAVDTEFLIEDWETDIIYKLQNYIKQYYKKWINIEYQENHEDYASIMSVGLMMGLVLQIQKFRIENNHTYAAHSYHVRSFLDSFGYLGTFVDALTREQAMYLYTNIKWLVTNKGKQKVLAELVSELLTPSNVPLVGYHLIHDTYEMAYRKSIYPKPIFKKHYYNLDPLTTDEGISVKQMLLKEKSLARDNADFIEDRTTETTDELQHTLFNRLNTKVLESDFTEVDSNLFFDLTEFQLAHWIFSVSRKQYKGSLFITHPLTGGKLQLTPYTALVLLIYSCSRRYLNTKLVTCPDLIVRNIVKNKTLTIDGETYPTISEINNIAYSPLTTSDKIKYLCSFSEASHLYTSTADFNQKTFNLFNDLEDRWSYAMADEDIFTNAELEKIASLFYYREVKIPSLLTTNYKTWLGNLGLEEDSLTDEMLEKLVSELLINGVGGSESSNRSIEKMHDALINILKFFLSYTTQLVSKYNKVSSRIYGVKQLRASVISREEIVKSFFDLPYVTLLETKQDSLEKVEMLISDSVIEPSKTNSVETSFLNLGGLTSFGLEASTEENVKFYNLLGVQGELIDEDTNEAKVYPSYTPVEAFIYGDLTSLFELYGQSLVMTLTQTRFTSNATFGLEPISSDSVSIKIKTGE